MKQKVEKVKESIPEQVKKAMDGRTQRWLSMNAMILESELSRKLKGTVEFSKQEIERINSALGSSIEL